MRETIELWLNGCELTLEQRVLAALLLTLASEFDAKPHTSTAAELRKTYLELRSSLKPADAEFDPLRDLITR
jgi:hypothetical protein